MSTSLVPYLLTTKFIMITVEGFNDFSNCHIKVVKTTYKTLFQI